jgi:mannose-6-phosphate isomerase
MQVALGEFWMLHGFRRLADVARDLDAVPELRPLLPELSTHAPAAWTAGEERAAWRRIYARVMTLPQQDVDRALVPLVARLKAQRAHRGLDRSSPDFWAVRAADQFALAEGHVDRGLVSIYLLNLLRLDASEATFIPAGVLHAYLEGRTVELMAASDNVLRGGLTPKHVDVAELLRILAFDPTEPARLRPVSRGGHTEFNAPVAEFALDRWALAAGESITERRDEGPTTLLVLEGRVSVSYGRHAGQATPLDRGGAVLVPACLSYAVEAETDCVVFAASVP